MEILFSNHYHLEITSADPIYVLSRLSAAGIQMRDVEHSEQWKIKLSVTGKYITTVKSVAKRLGCDVKVISLKGPAVFCRFLKNRAALICGMIVLTVLTLYIPTRVLFVEVEGNRSLETMHILEKAEQVGISFGASRKYVRSEKMKNALLEAVPQLKWAGINTYGCRAVITVAERDEADTPQIGHNCLQGIYAYRDGIVSRITVTKGTALCKSGDAVTAGQLLISGYTDCGLLTRAERAEGEVYAVTSRKIQAVAPFGNIYRGAVTEETARWSIQLGKKRINLYIGSGNFGAGCGKIYESIDLTLPGGFKLPISLIKETFLDYQDIAENDAACADIAALAEDYISSMMIAGKILHCEPAYEVTEDLSKFSGVYVCEEMIGKIHNEEIQ